MKARLLIVLTFSARLGTSQISPVMVGHEYREDDLPSITVAPDGSVWVAWLSFDGRRDDVAIRRWDGERWSNLHWVPGVSGDSWLPQVTVDGSSRVWVVWSQQVNGNWDIYARRFDPKGQEWGRLERLSSHPLPDINPRVWSDATGRAAIVWQGFRGRHSNIFLRTLEGDGWSEETRVTNREANDWDPSVALDAAGTAWVAFDSYRNGDYDVFLSEIRRGAAPRPEIAVAATPRFETRATVAVDTRGRVWVAWEAGRPNWGKDSGYIVRSRFGENRLGGFREPRIRCYSNGAWREPAASLASAYEGAGTYQPHVFSDGRGSVWIAAMMRKAGPKRTVFPFQPGYWEYWVTHLDGDEWSPPTALPDSKGRSSTRMSAAVAADGGLWMSWPTDSRQPSYFHRPVRQRVFAGRIQPPTAAVDPVLKAVEEEKVDFTPVHAGEAAAVQAIRSYRTAVDGKPSRILRGDFHRHTELSWDEGGAGDASLQDMYRYMIDASALDFGATTDHQGGAWPYWWWYTQKMTDMYLSPDAFVPVFGYERSASYPFGHRNMFFARRGDARVTPFFLKEGVRIYQFPLSPEGDEPADETGELARNDTRLLLDEVRQAGGISIPHTSAMNNFGTDWVDTDPAVEPVVEIFQGCRMSSEAAGAPYAYAPDDQRFGKQYNGGGMLSNAWSKGYRLGVIASSDHSSTHISYAMVYTADTTREGILDAIRRRHTYGATDNIILDVRMGARFMGDAFALTRAEPLRVKAVGTASIAKVEVIKDGKVVYAASPGKREVDLEFQDREPTAGQHYYYVRLQQADGMIAWSSPFFIN